MKRLAFLILCLAGCVVEPAQENTAHNTLSIHNSVYEDEMNIANCIACKPETFVADAIPPGYILDPNCPPNIIWPPLLILPNNPKPIILTP